MDIFGRIVFDWPDGHHFFRGERVSEAKTRNRSLVETYFKKWAWRLGMHVGTALSRVAENVT